MSVSLPAPRVSTASTSIDYSGSTVCARTKLRAKKASADRGKRRKTTVSRCQGCGVRLARDVTVCPRDGAAVAPAPPAPPGEGEPVQISIPGYTLGPCLGTGGFGSVFDGVRLSDRLAVAIKVAHRVPSDAGLRLEREG